MFYYRSKRVGSRVRKTYYGNGPLAVLVAEQDELGRAAQVQESSARRSSTGSSGLSFKWSTKPSISWASSWTDWGMK